MNARALTLGVLLAAAPAHAQDLKDRFNLRLSLTGMYLAEQQEAPSREARAASPFELGYGELRAVLDARRLPGQLDLHLDARIRVSGQFSTDAATVGADQVVARGYLGGREYELRQIWVRRRGDQVDFGLGRMIVAEADALRLDGARLWYRPSPHWDVSAFAGAYPDPYSRSLTDDYGNAFTFAGGLSGAYTYDRMWGSFAAVGAYLGGSDDGGRFDPANPAGRRQDENVRAFFTWTNFWRALSWLDLHHDLVVDVAGAAGAQLTRLDLFATARAGRFVTLRLGYDHLSPIAIELYLTRLLANRPDFLAGTIENNLTVQRTARDEGRAQIELTFARTSVYAEGRIRRRVIVDLQDDPQFASAGTQLAPGLAGDATVGVRDRGSLYGLRGALWYTFLSDYRARSHLLGVELGRGFLGEQLSVDGNFLYAATRDAQAGAVCDPTAIGFLPLKSCFGARDGATYEMGLTVSGLVSRFFGFVDYRLVVDTSSGPDRALLTHLLLLRLEARF